MYIFNPEHDLCLANGDIHFVPPQSALQFGKDCSSLVKFMRGLDSSSDSDNLIYPVSNPSDHKINKIVPWGWDSVLCNRLLKEGYAPGLLPTEDELQAIKELSHRQLALDAHNFVCESVIGGIAADGSGNTSIDALNAITPANYRIAAKSLEEVESFIREHKNVVLKAPLSGSGKGIRFVADALSHSDAGWCRNLIKKHGCVIVEQRFRPLLECAMLFECVGSQDASMPDSAGSNDKGQRNRVVFRGYSLFYANNGMYSGNVLASNEFIEQKITECLFGGSCREADVAKVRVNCRLLEKVKTALIEYLQKNVAPRYSGFVGVDQFVYTEFDGNYASEIPEDAPCGGNRLADYKACAGGKLFFNPVVEINLRMTMGLLARNIYDRFAAELQLQDGSHRFEILHSKEGMAYRIEPMDFLLPLQR